MTTEGDPDEAAGPGFGFSPRSFQSRVKLVGSVKSPQPRKESGGFINP
jgi:hypothetical protein